MRLSVSAETETWRIHVFPATVSYNSVCGYSGFREVTVTKTETETPFFNLCKIERLRRKSGGEGKKTYLPLLIFILATLKINSEQNDCLMEEVYGSNGFKIQLDDSAKRLLARRPAMTRPFASPECRADFKRRLAEFFGVERRRRYTSRCHGSKFFGWQQ